MFMLIRLIAILQFLCLAAMASANDSQPGLLHAGGKLKIEDTSVVAIILNNEPVEMETASAELQLPDAQEVQLVLHYRDESEKSMSLRLMPAWLSLFPPLIAILFALLFREVVTALLGGIFSGVIIAAFYQNGDQSVWLQMLRIMDQEILRSLVPDASGGSVDRGHMSVVLFSVLIGGMVGLISKNGGMSALVKRVSSAARSARSAQLATYFMGVLIFFDDYANTLIVGHTMRPLTDRMKISREKLAYIVDSTAAPVASLAFITTWIGAELGYISEGLQQIEGLSGNVYGFFFQSLRYSFYPLLTLIFILILILRNRDFGPMLQAEKKARSRIQAVSDQAKNDSSEEVVPAHEYSFNALLPIAVVVFGTLAALLYTGWDEAVWQSGKGNVFTRLSAIIGGSDSYLALLWASFWGLVIAVASTVLSRALGLRESIEKVLDGFKAMVPAIVILVLAWALAGLTERLHTADFLTGLLMGKLSPYWLPGLTLLMAALVSFATGSSWGTMAILYPIMLPLAWTVGADAGIMKAENLEIFYNVIASVLAGSVLGDHCSPISDTTILSSLASDCDHISHVRTQMPYALTVGLAAIIFGSVLVHFLPPWICLVLASVALYFTVSFLGKKPDV